MDLDQIVACGKLPEDKAFIEELFLEPNGSFIAREADQWDFKEHWPTSYSDSYFGGIAKLVCAFANTRGGLIIFGVNDKTRRTQAGRFQPNMDAFEIAIRQLTSVTLDIDHRCYQMEGNHYVDVLLVRERNKRTAPIVFKKPVANYAVDVVWVRKGSSCLPAQSQDIETVFLSNKSQQDDSSISSGLPSSPSTLKTFVGRFNAICRIYSWIYDDDEPRAFLWGKGGSGKSTIAYEICRHIQYNGKLIEFVKGQSPECVIYISAKELYLNIGSLTAESFSANDFSDEASQYRAILTLGDHEIDPSDDCDIDKLKELVKRFFDSTSCFLVIDDIDTLTTNGKEPGIDFIYRCVSRSKKSSKILYTMRNRPTQSISSSIEIEGLRDFEFDEFISKCGEELGVQVPKAGPTTERLRQISEGRPLVIESIMRLRRSCGTYDEAFEAFEAAPGDTIRDYVFDREWNAIDPASRGRELLAILALYDRPIGFGDLAAILRIDEQKVRDALGAVQEMFLEVDSSADETMWSVGDLTKDYIIVKSKKLDRFETIKRRVENFRSTFYADSPEINQIKRRAEKAIWQRKNGNFDGVEDMIAYMASIKDRPKVTEDPRYLSIRGFLNLWRDPTRLDLARADFESVFSLRYSPEFEYVKEWFDAEKGGDMALIQTAKILNLVLKSKGYDSSTKAWFRSMRASFLYAHSRDFGSDSPAEALNWLKESIELHLQVYRMRMRNPGISINKNSEYAVNTALHAVNITRYSDESFFVIRAVSDILKKNTDLYLDPLVQPISYCFEMISRHSMNSAGDRNKALGFINMIRSEWLKDERWFDKAQRDLLRSLIDTRKRLIEARSFH